MWVGTAVVAGKQDRRVHEKKLKKKSAAYARHCRLRHGSHVQKRTGPRQIRLARCRTRSKHGGRLPSHRPRPTALLPEGNVPAKQRTECFTTRESPAMNKACYRCPESTSHVRKTIGSITAKQGRTTRTAFHFNLSKNRSSFPRECGVYSAPSSSSIEAESDSIRRVTSRASRFERSCSFINSSAVFNAARTAIVAEGCVGALLETYFICSLTSCAASCTRAASSPRSLYSEP